MVLRGVTDLLREVVDLHLRKPQPLHPLTELLVFQFLRFGVWGLGFEI